MKRSKSWAAAVAASALLVSLAGAAGADEVENDIQPQVSTGLELMTLELGSTTGSVGRTALSIWADPNDGVNAGGPNADGCNFVGNKTLTITAHNTAPGVAKIEFAGDDNVLSSCTDKITVVVTAKHKGEADITFTGDFSTGDKADMNVFGFDRAAFHVVVNRVDSGDDGQVTKCDADPAAPAWAAAILKASGVKPGRTKYRNAIRAVAREMGPGTDFQLVPRDGQFKVSPRNYDYPNKVRTFLSVFLDSDGLVDPKDVHRPGWVCRTIS
jgi:hypothetical protein